MAKTIIQVESNITHEDFIRECFGLSIPEKMIPLLTKKAFPSLAATFIDELITRIKETKDKANVVSKEKVKSVQEKGKTTIHSVIMTGLRAGQDNTTLIVNLRNTFPDKVEQKLKQRVYEYRNHFNKGKIK